MTRAHGRPGERAVRATLVLTAGFMIAEIAGGLLTGSLALLADAGHMLSDAGSLAIAYIAMRYARRPANARKTYGYYRAEILAALVNGMTLVIVAVFVFVEAGQRFQSPPEVKTGPMLLVAVLGLVVNLVCAKILSGSREDSLNVHGAYLHVLGDTLGSVGTIAAALVMIATGWYLADALISVLIGGLILFSSRRLLRESVNILMEGTPPGVDAQEAQAALLSVPGVAGLHDLHIWTLTTGFHAVSVHLVVKRNLQLDETQALVERVRDLLRERFDIQHTTIQVEYSPPARNASVVM